MYEIEIKSLLGGKDEAEELKKRLSEVDPATKLVSRSKQLNHYFIGGSPNKLYEAAEGLLKNQDAAKLKEIIEKGEDFSVRTRELNGKILLVVKASVDDTTSSNGISRLEFEEEVNLESLEELDKILLDAGFNYQAKWSREREEYICRGANVSIDKNAGYGYLAEFEKVLGEDANLEEARIELRSLMDEVEAVELQQDRLERMFAYYNEHWPDYYGTEKTFVIE